MDPITHTLSGVAVAQVLPLEESRTAVTLTLAVAANLPDVDAFVRRLKSTAFIEFHHGITHSLPGMTILSLLFSAVWAPLSGLSYPLVLGFSLLGCMVHTAGDLLIHIYGIPLFLDCARAVQFIRHNAKQWNLDPTRIACAGGSAGSGMSLWIGFHKDLADPNSDDPVARESTKLTCVAVFNAQTSYDPRWIKEKLPGKAYKTPNIWQLVGINPPKFRSPDEQFDELFKNITPEKAKLMEDCSPINHLTAEAPPVFLRYLGQPLRPRQAESDNIHQIGFGLRLKEKMDALKVECEIVGGWPKNPECTGQDKTELEFLRRHFGMKQGP